MNERLLLIHTGKVRLARNLLQNVIRNWYAREDGTVDCFRRLVENTEACKTALLQGIIFPSMNSLSSLVLVRFFVLSRKLSRIWPLYRCLLVSKANSRTRL